MTIADRKEREKAQRRSDIIDAAERMFFSGKYDEVVMSDIARNVDLNKATLYLYFKNKESLYFAVITRGLTIMRDMFLEAAQCESNGREMLLAMAGAFFRFCHEYPSYYRLMCEARTRRFDMLQVEGALEQMAIANEIIGALCESIKLGIKDGSIMEGLKPMETTAFVMSCCENAARPSIELQWALGSRKISPGRYLEHTIGMMMFSLTGHRISKKQLKAYIGEHMGEGGVGLW